MTEHMFSDNIVGYGDGIYPLISTSTLNDYINCNIIHIKLPLDKQTNDIKEILYVKSSPKPGEYPFFHGDFQEMEFQSKTWYVLRNDTWIPLLKYETTYHGELLDILNLYNSYIEELQITLLKEKENMLNKTCESKRLLDTVVYTSCCCYNAINVIFVLSTLIH